MEKQKWSQSRLIATVVFAVLAVLVSANIINHYAGAPPAGKHARSVVAINRRVSVGRTATVEANAPHFHFHAWAVCSNRALCGSNYNKVMWTRDAVNMVTRAGCEALLTQTFKTQTAPGWYVGEIKAYTSFSTQDTMASHANWTSEAAGATDITNANRPAFTPGAVDKSADGVFINNNASAAVFTQASTITLKGLYITDSNQVGGATGVLYGEATFTDAPVAAGYTVNVTSTLTATAG